MANIRIQPDEARAIASAFRTESENTQTVISNLESLIVRLEGAWEGRAFESFKNNFEEFKVSFNKMIPLIENEALNLDTAARNFEEADSASAV